MRRFKGRLRSRRWWRFYRAVSLAWSADDAAWLANIAAR